MKKILTLIVLAVIFFALGSIASTGQQLPTCDTCWKYFQPEKTFQIGAVGLTWAKIAKDTLGIAFLRDYGIAPAGLWDGYLNPAIDTAGWSWHHYYIRNAWKSFGPNNYRVVGALSNMVGITRAVYCQENYPGYSLADVQALPMTVRYQNSAADTIMTGLIYPVTVTKLTSRQDTLMVSDPTYTKEYGFYRGSPALYAKLGYVDSCSYFRFSYAISVDSLNNGAPTDTVAYSVLYYRNRRFQENCRCNVYSPFDTLYIRRSDVSNFNTPTVAVSKQGQIYKEYGKTLNMALGNVVYKRDSTVIRRTFDLAGKLIRDTTIKFAQFYVHDAIDTVVGLIYGARKAISINTISSTVHDSIIVTWDSIQLTRVPLYIPGPLDFIYGHSPNWFGYGSSGSGCTSYVSARPTPC